MIHFCPSSDLPSNEFSWEKNVTNDRSRPFSRFAADNPGKIRARPENLHFSEYLNTHRVPFSQCFSPGLEEFEDKIDKIAGGNADENSWIGNLYNKFKGSFLGNDAIDANTVEMDGLEPPVLDDKWGLGDVASLYDEKNSEYIFTLMATGLPQLLSSRIFACFI